ncbi:kinase-like domain-containing protein [Mycena alexandri]|uniref:Kinase-like domain-containing protein n=1 Tax=Mycena alexandri TaxID=1745969 RepID=A0AAD6TL50_9AGAR|nr:kinase-like domain-containing protein [Mycena alexandri]
MLFARRSRALSDFWVGGLEGEYMCFFFSSIDQWPTVDLGIPASLKTDIELYVYYGTTQNIKEGPRQDSGLVLPLAGPKAQVKPLISKSLLRLSRASGLHPQCFQLPDLEKIGQQVAAGGSGDIWKGLVRGQIVSVKVMRIFQDKDIEAALKEFSREALIWRQLCHPNLLPFFGLYYLDGRLCLVSPWMENGNIVDFLRNEPPDTDRLSLIVDVALGLQYLCEQNVVHGDLKGINVLVTPLHRACIADFGLSSIVNAMTLQFTHSTADMQGGTARYYAPELFRPKIQKHFGSDIYAFACVCYEILTGDVPFHDIKNDMAVMLQVLQGERPSQPTECSGTRELDNLWELLQNCWHGEAERRPSASEIVQRLIGPSIWATATSFAVDWDDTFTSKFRRSIQAQTLLPAVSQIEHMLFGEEIAQACHDCFPDSSDKEDSSDDSDSDSVEIDELEARLHGVLIPVTLLSSEASSSSTLSPQSTLLTPVDKQTMSAADESEVDDK